MIDIDNFKKFNDHYGHMLGDCILKGVAATFMNMLRKDNYVVRYGGDEFVVLLYKASEIEAERVLEKIKKEIRENKIKCEGKEFSVSFSYGIVSLGEAQTFNEMLKIADSRLYEAKRLKNIV